MAGDGSFPLLLFDPLQADQLTRVLVPQFAPQIGSPQNLLRKSSPCNGPPFRYLCSAQEGEGSREASRTNERKVLRDGTLYPIRFVDGRKTAFAP
jgi:hypothetical protein